MTAAGFYHCSVSPVSRGKGASAVHKAAYRAGLRLVDERTGEAADYRARGGVEETFVLARPGAPEWKSDIGRLFNEAERAEPRANGRLATEIVVGLPHELTPEARKAALMDYVTHIVERHGVAAHVAIHAPDKEGDWRNHHAHILFTHRELGPEGFGDIANTRIETRQRKGREVQEKVSGIAATPADIKAMRLEWEQCVNREYERAGLDVRVDHRSHKDRGIEAEPAKHLGPAASAMERGEPGSSDRGDLNRQIEERNAALRERAALEIEAVKAAAELAAARQLAEIERRAEAAEREARAQAQGRRDDIRPDGERSRYDDLRATERDASRSQAEGGRYDDLRAAEPAPEIARQFAASTARATEPAAPAWDRDAASRDTDERIIDAAVAATEKARRRPEAGAGRETSPLSRGQAQGAAPDPAAAAPKAERELSGTAADIRMAWSMTRTPGDLKDALAARGIGLGMVSAEEAQASQRAAAFAKEVGNFAPSFAEGEIVAVSSRGVYRLDERTTGQGPLDVQGRLNGLDHAALADVTATRAATRAAGLEAWKQEQRAERERARDPNWVEQRIADCAHRAGIDGALVQVDGAGQRVDRLAALADQHRPDGQRQTEGQRVTGREAFAARLEEAGIAIARVTDADAKALEALRADERNERLAASVNGAARRDRHFAELAPGDLAAVTRGGDVYRINLDKCGAARSHLPDALPGVMETRARFEIERGREGEFWARRRTDIFEAQQRQAAERESRADTRAISRDAADLAAAAEAAMDTGARAEQGVRRGLFGIFASIIGFLADSIAPPPPPTRDQAERMARSADERQEAQQQQQARAAEQEFMLREIERSRQSADRRPTEAPTAAELYGTPKPGGQERDTDRERDRGLEL